MSKVKTRPLERPPQLFSRLTPSNRDLSAIAETRWCQVRWNQYQQSDTANHSENRAEQKHGGKSDLVPQPSGNEARQQTAQPHDRVVPTDTARAELFRHVVARQSFADGPKYSLIEPVADEEYGDERYAWSQCEAEVGGQEYCEGQDQDVPSTQSVRQKSCRVGNQ